MSEPLAYLITWTCYGSWLPGDERGWVESGTSDIQIPDPQREATAKLRMTESNWRLDFEQCRIVKETIVAHCDHRCWHLHAVNVRTNHVHAVVSASTAPDTVISQLKSWCTRRLREQQRCSVSQRSVRKKWWTEGGSTKWINDQTHLENAIRYVLDGQSHKSHKQK